mmetsp:Transcript_99116/g.278614  ORF Transcript_99116/g.278614 Transcript_99116/m.278614 type:complete len:138 (+) Transcript_99116:254-667(+)
MPELSTGGSGASAGGAAGPGGASSDHMLQALRLQLGNLQRVPCGGEGAVPEPSTSRSYHTARSHCSSRSGRSSKDRKERKSGRTREERRAQREAAASAAAFGALGGPSSSTACSLPEETAAPVYEEDVARQPAPYPG